MNLNPTQNYFEKTEKIYELIEKTQDMKLNLWLENVVFTPHWWLGVFLSIVPWVAWFYFHNKRSRHRMLFVGFGVIIIASFLDFLGVKLGLWMYHYEVWPLVPAYLPFDWTLLPVVIISLIEYKPNHSPILKGFLFAMMTTFVGEPFFTLVDIYKPLNWSMFYSFPIYFLLFLFANWLSRREHFERLA